MSLRHHTASLTFTEWRNALALIGGYRPAQRAVKRGQVWGLGHHRLMCGSSADAHDINRLFNGEQAKCLFTSPPYSDMRNYDGTWDGDFTSLMKGVCSILPSVMTQDHQLLIVLGCKIVDGQIYEYWDDWKRWMKLENNYILFDQYVRDKLNPNPISMNRQYRTHELIYHFNRIRRVPNRTVLKKQDNIAYQKYFGKLRADGTRDGPRHNHNRAHPSLRLADDVFRVAKESNPGVRGEHPAIFPISLVEEVLSIWSDAGDLCFEPFAGSGTSIIAAENIGRRMLAMEIVPHYVEIALQAWEQTRGTKPTLLV